MSAVRVPGSLRRSIAVQPAQHAAPARKEGKTATLVTAAALLTAASPLSLAIAQQGGTLPQLNVETTQAKKKAQAAPAEKSGKTAPSEARFTEGS